MFYLQARNSCLRVIKKKDYRKEDPQITQINTNLKIVCHVLPTSTQFLSERNKKKDYRKEDPQITLINTNLKIACHVLPTGKLLLSEGNKKKRLPKRRSTNYTD